MDHVRVDDRHVTSLASKLRELLAFADHMRVDVALHGVRVEASRVLRQHPGGDADGVDHDLRAAGLGRDVAVKEHEQQPLLRGIQEVLKVPTVCSDAAAEDEYQFGVPLILQT